MAAHREYRRTRHIYGIAIPSPTAQHQLPDTKLPFAQARLLHLSTLGKSVLVPQMLVTSIVAMYHNSEFYGHLGAF